MFFFLGELLAENSESLKKVQERIFANLLTEFEDIFSLMGWLKTVKISSTILT